MESFYTFLTILSGLALRLGVPIAATAIVIFFLRKLDNRWKKEAMDSLNRPRIEAALKPCWEVNHCSSETKENCPAYQNQNTPCWQVFRSDQGLLKENCLGCDVFRLTPLPVIGD